jgi:hypothetical protein
MKEAKLAQNTVDCQIKSLQKMCQKFPTYNMATTKHMEETW